MSIDPKRSLEKERTGYNNYLRYTGLGFTMIGVVFVCCYAGWWLDKYLAWKFPLFTISFSLFGIAGSMVYLFKETGSR